VEEFIKKVFCITFIALMIDENRSVNPPNMKKLLQRTTITGPKKIAEIADVQEKYLLKVLRV